MRIAPLHSVPFPQLVDTILRAFEGYFVQLPAEVAYWRDRFRGAGVDLARSYGAFAGDELVAFIIQGFGVIDGEPTAYNSGTGVLPAHRGKRLVDALYAHALPTLRSEGITRCSLEVIDRNAMALRVYERIGFTTQHRWHCFKGRLIPAEKDRARWVPIDLLTADLGDDRHACWDHRLEALRRSPGRQRAYALNGDAAQGHVVLDVGTGRIARIGVADEHDAEQWAPMLTALARIKTEVVLVNVHPQRTALLSALRAARLENHIDQFEMRLAVP